MSIFDTLNYFSAHEFSQPDQMDRSLLILLDWIRGQSGLPIFVTSSYRDGDPGAHGRGTAVDISDNMRGDPLGSSWRYLVLKAAYNMGIPRIGDYDRHLHIDIDQTLPQHVAWPGESQ